MGKNQAFEKLTEYTLDEVKGKKPGSFLQGEKTNQEDVDTIRKAIAAETEVDVNLFNYSKSGKEYVLNINISPIYGTDGKLVNP